MFTRKTEPTPVRSFVLTVGLREGYGSEALVHPEGQVWWCIKNWMTDRAKNKLPFLTGIVSDGEVIYTWPGNKKPAEMEPVIQFSGEINPLYNPDMTDSMAEEILEDLAGFLGKHLNQTRVYIKLSDRMWILEDKEKDHPTK